MIKKIKKNKNIDGLRSFAPVMIGLGAIYLAAIGLLAIPINTNIHTKTTAVKKLVVHTLVTPTTQATTPKTTATASPTISSKPVVAVANPNNTKPEPVVVPSPSSNVSGLTPTTPVTPPSSSGSGGSTTQSTPATTTSYTSTNWSGYMASGSNFNGVSASWIAPTAIGVGSFTSADSTWIGIGGVSTSDLIQVGTQDTVASNGQVTTSAFYELLPSFSQTIPNLKVTPGDSLTASLNEISSGQWAISITDNTNGESYNSSVSYNSSNSSAEWIEEDPSYAFRLQIPFDNFQTVSFANAATAVNSSSIDLTSAKALPITMVNTSGQNIATPYAVGSDGNSFTVTRNDVT